MFQHQLIYNVGLIEIKLKPRELELGIDSEYCLVFYYGNSLIIDIVPIYHNSWIRRHMMRITRYTPIY